MNYKRSGLSKMKDKLEEKFLDYIEGVMTDAQSREMESALKNDSQLRKSFEEYKNVIELEEVLSKESTEAGPGFETKVMTALEESRAGFLERLIMAMNVKQVAGGFASCAVLLIGVKLAFDHREEILTISPSFESVQEVPETSTTEVERTARIYDKLLERIKPEESSTSTPPEITTFPPPPPPPQPMGENSEPAGEDNRRVKLLAGVNPPSNDQNYVILNNEPAHITRGPGRASSGVATEFSGRDFSGRTRQDVQAWSSPSREVLYGYMRHLQHPAYSRDSYKDHGENPRIKTSTEAMSTFSIDVDTASYTNARRFLSTGVLPPREAIRIEEFLNYFSYNYPSQTEETLALNYEIAPSPLEPGRHLLKLGVKARDLTPDPAQSEKGWNLVFLVDVSGSMRPEDRLPLAKQALRILVNQMRPQDTIGIVTYAGTTSVALEPTSGENREKILGAIDELQARGATCGSGGIKLAYRMAQENMIEGSVNRVILATDGDFNVGITSFDELLKLVEEKRRSGVTLTTLGFGRGNLQDHLMEQLANKGNGNYFYIDSLREARKVLEHDLISNMEVVASDVKLQIEFNPKHVLEYRLIGYENRKLRNEDFRNDRVDAGEIGPGHTVTALYELVLADSRLAQTVTPEYRYQESAEPAAVEQTRANDLKDELAFFKISYKEPGSSSSVEVQHPLPVEAVRHSLEGASSDFLFASAVSYFAHLLRGSTYVGDYTYEEVAKLAEKSKGEDSFGYRQELIELIKNASLGSSKTRQNFDTGSTPSAPAKCISGRARVGGMEVEVDCDGSIRQVR